MVLIFMKKIVSVVIAAAVISAMLPISVLADEEHELSAHSAIVMCADTGDVIFEKNADEIMYPASTTKVLTGYIALQMADLDNDIVTVSQNAIDLVPPTYQTIPLSAGEHTVTFTYHNAAFALGWKISLACFVMFGVMLYLCRKPQKATGRYEARKK